MQPVATAVAAVPDTADTADTADSPRLAEGRDR
jgi:hypothetical protein